MRRLPHSYSRRSFLALAGAGMMGMAFSSGLGLTQGDGDQLPNDGSIYREFGGSDLTGWRITVGDGIYAAPGEPPVSVEDIETRHDGNLSEVRANIRRRRIMAHNITYLRERDALALEYTHIYTCAFRLPYMPSVENTDENAQTMDAGLFVWDGINTMMDWGMAFQWGLNPRERFGEIRVNIEGVTAAAWEPVGYFAPDTEWHRFEIIVDYPTLMEHPTVRPTLRIDDTYFPSNFVGIYKRWPAAISAGLQVEAISIYPGTTMNGALHRVEFKDWSWQWVDMEHQQTYLPSILNNAGGSEGYKNYLPYVSAAETESAEGAAP
jgi:hypothetical protein